MSYADCNWTASGELDCHGAASFVHMPSSRDVDNSSLNRELEVSVYAPRIQTSNMIHLSTDANNFPISDKYPRIDNFSNTQGVETQKIHWFQQPPKWSKKTGIKKNVWDYFHQTPMQKYQDIVSEIGQPTIVNPNRGGLAIWQKANINNPKYNVFERIEIIDEQCFNDFPQPHNGFFYTSVKFAIPIQCLSNILSISGDITYDPPKKLLTVRGMSLSFNVALITVVCLYISGDISWYDIIDRNLVNKYLSHDRLINIRIQESNLRKLRTMLKHK